MNDPKQRSQKDLAKDLGVTLKEGETISEETLNEFSGNKGDDDDE